MGSEEEKKVKEGKKYKSISRIPWERDILRLSELGGALGGEQRRGLGHSEGSRVYERAPAGPLVHEPVSLKACLCLASLLEAHLLISTKEKNGVGNMWMPSLPCLGSHVARTQYSAWGRKQGE